MGIQVTPVLKICSCIHNRCSCNTSSCFSTLMTKPGCVTVRGMLPNDNRNVLFTATFEDDTQAEEFSSLMKSNRKLAFMMVQMECKSLKCVALPTLGLNPIPEDRESVC